MENIVVGSEDCSIADIWTILSKSFIIKEKWSDYARYLRIPSEDIEKFRQDLVLDKASRNDILSKILHIWVADQGSNAQLADIIRVVENECGDNSVGERLRLQFNLPCKESEKLFLKWSDLSLAFKQKVTKTAEMFWPNVDMEEHVKSEPESKSLRDLLIPLMCGEKPNIFKQTIPQKLSYYVPRYLLPRNIICHKILDEDIKDIFLFTGLERHELSDMLENHMTGTSKMSLDVVHITSRFMILSQPIHFEKICKITHDPVHLLHNQDGKLQWTKSRGSLDHLQKFIEAPKKSLTEVKLIEILGANSNQPICLSDSPGMGKSILLKELAAKLEEMYSDRIVAYFNLPEFIRIKQRFEDTIRSLRTSLCLGKFSEAVLLSYINSSEPKLELLLDGLDEVPAKDYNMALKKLRLIRYKYPSIRLWVTTRPHCLSELEKTFEVLGYNIRPFDEADQRTVLISYWQNPKINKAKLNQYAKKVLKTVKSKLGSEDVDIAGIPLQCHLIAEVFEEEAIDFAQNDKEISSFPGLRMDSITDLYKHFVSKRFQNYLTVHTENAFLGMDCLMKMHYRVAMQLLIPDCLTEEIKGYFGKVNLDEMVKIGIVESFGDREPLKLIHRTFGEFLLAKFIVETISNANTTLTRDIKNILQCVFRCNNINLYVLDETLSTYRFENEVICHFISSLLPREHFWANCPTYVPDPNICDVFLNPLDIFHACSFGNYFQLFRFFQINFERTFLSIVDENFIRINVKCSSNHFIDVLLNHLGKNVSPSLQIKMLRVASQRGEYTTMEYLLKERKLKDLVKNKTEGINKLLHDCISNTKFNSSDQVHERIQVIRYLIKLNPNLLEEKDELGRTPLLCEYANVDLIIELIAQHANLFAQDNNGDIFIHITKERHRRISSTDFEMIIKRIPKPIFTELVQLKAEYGHTPLMRFIGLQDPSVEMLKLFHEAGADFNTTSNEDYSILAVAIVSFRYRRTIRKLIELGADLLWRKQNAKSGLLHIAAYYGNEKAVRMLIKEYNFDPNTHDETGLTPIDYVDLNTKPTHYSKCSDVVATLKELGGKSKKQQVYYPLPRTEYGFLEKLNNDGRNFALPLISPARFRNIISAPRTTRSTRVDYEHQFCTRVQDFVERKGMVFVDATDIRGNHLLHLAVDRMDYEAVRNLMESGANANVTNAKGETALHRACYCNNSEFLVKIVKYLVSNGADTFIMDNHGLSFLHVLMSTCAFYITKDDFHEIVKFLSKQELTRLFLTSSKYQSTTPLELAIANIEMQVNTLEIFNDAGIDFSKLDSNGQSVLFHAVKGNRSVEQYSNLIKFKADWKLVDKMQNNLLHISAEVGNLEALKFFVNMGLSVKKENYIGNTPIHSAIIFGKDNVAEICRLLIKEGGCVNSKNLEGCTPLELAEEKCRQIGNSELLKIFETE